jgi:uncharacterized protein YecE (DUF72 family)
MLHIPRISLSHVEVKGQLHRACFPQNDTRRAKRRIARAAADPARIVGAGEPGGWNKLAYFRWHGSPRIYYSDYGAAALKALKRCLEDRVRDSSTWCIFDNTTSGAALGNALTLARSLQHQRGANNRRRNPNERATGNTEESARAND